MKKKISVQKYMILHNVPSAFGFICLGISMQFTSNLAIMLAAIAVILLAIPVVTSLMYWNKEKREYEDELAEINIGKSSRISISIVYFIACIVTFYSISMETTILLAPSTLSYLMATLQLLKISTFIVYEKMGQL